MTTFSTWNTSTGGLFSTSHDWSPIGVPNSGNSDAGLPSFSQAYTVTSDLNETLDFLNVGSANALFEPTLAITGGTFSVVSTAHTYSNVYNFGTITVGAASTLLLGANVSGDSTEINGPGTRHRVRHGKHPRHDSHHADQCALHGPVWRRASPGHRQWTDSRLDDEPDQLAGQRRHHLWRRLHRQRRERACRRRPVTHCHRARHDQCERRPRHGAGDRRQRHHERRLDRDNEQWRPDDR